MKEHLDIEADIVELRNSHKDDPDFHERLKKLEGKLAEVGIASFFDALEEYSGGKGGDEEFRSYREDFNNLNRKLWLSRNLEPGEVAKLLEQRKKVLETMLPKLRTLMEGTVRGKQRTLGKV